MNRVAEVATRSTTSVRFCELPVAWSDRRALLDVGAVAWESTDRSSRHRRGSHSGGFDQTPFDFGGALAGHDVHEAVVRRSDPTDRQHHGNWGYQPYRDAEALTDACLRLHEQLSRPSPNRARPPHARCRPGAARSSASSPSPASHPER